MNKSLLLSILIIFLINVLRAQVGINTTTVSPGAMLEIKSSNKGFLPPRVSLNSVNDNTTIPNNTKGVMVYNTNDSGNAANDVKPGYYYWSNPGWKRLRQEGFSHKVEQSTQVRASSSSSDYVTLPGLDYTFTPTVTGTYQIIVNAYYAVERPSGSTNVRAKNASNGNLNVYTNINHNSAGQASIRLLMNNSISLGEKYAASYGMAFPDGQKFWAHGAPIIIVLNTELIAGTSYNFKVQGREWTRYNSSNSGIFGWNTNLHIGNAGGNAKAQHGDMTITLISEI